MNNNRIGTIGFSALFELSIISNSCCTEKNCVSAFELREIKLSGFSLLESDPILFSSYVKGSSFTILTDSATTSARTQSGLDTGDLMIFVPMEFNAASDYSVEFKKTGITYKISEINTSQKECNNCFFTSDNFTELSGYKLNGQVKVTSVFEIVK